MTVCLPCPVCSQYLYRYPADEDLLWVVEGIGGPYQKQSVASKLKALAPKGKRAIHNRTMLKDKSIERQCK